MDNEPLVTQPNTNPMGVDPSTDQQPWATPPEAPVIVKQASSTGQTKRNPMMVWVIAGIVIVVGIMLLYIFRSSIIPPKPPLPEVTITSLPSPTPIRVLSSIATQSAFMSLEQNASSVSSGIANTNLDDPSLSPPVIDLPLGFVE